MLLFSAPKEIPRYAEPSESSSTASASVSVVATVALATGVGIFCEKLLGARDRTGRTGSRAGGLEMAILWILSKVEDKVFAVLPLHLAIVKRKKRKLTPNKSERSQIFI